MKHAHAFNMAAPEEVQEWLDSDKPFLLLDTLPPDHYRQVHLPEAKNACVYEMTFLDQVAALTAENGIAIVVYGSSANSLDALTAAEKLTMAGYSDISVLEGGIQRWRQSGYTLEGESAGKDDIFAAQRRLEDGTYTILSESSSIDWTGRNSNSRHYGTVKISGGELSIGDNSVQGSFTIDMDTIENINLVGNELQPVLITHLKSDDFFFVDAFPAARLNIRSGRISHEPYSTLPNCELTGTLDLRGVQNDLNFKAVITKGMDGDLRLTAHFDLDRTLWGITYGSSRFYEHLGMHTVFDDITIDLQLVARKIV